MTHYQLRSRQNNTILFEGDFHSFTACLERAVALGTNLAYIDLARKNLSNAHLDDGLFAHADFSCSNLTGTNLSEATLTGAHFGGASLYNTCFAESDLTGCDFQNASFGATDITGTLLDHTRFSTLSCFSLDFSSAHTMTDCLFIHPDGHTCRMSRPPVVVKGLGSAPVIFMDENIQIGYNIIDGIKNAQIPEDVTLGLRKIQSYAYL